MNLTFPILYLLNEQLDIARGSKMGGAAKKKELTEIVRGFCKQVAFVQGVKQTGKVWIGFEWRYWNDAIDPADNLPASLKPILDAMVKERIILDDSSEIIQFPIVHTRIKSKDHTVTLHIFETRGRYRRWVMSQL